ncbi:hypothetical protein Q5425_37610 [Amycolatopsis sp. A133]|jgi:hypothetical protein|uniref:hypothetical protein n=1 Tax=Amycolatopsis sp. A133 TaxID=3064472 RepID=UPI0027F09171|nr:hypothetical protein [Amycolatopsis sp. A133]MDQ7809473.1 hypothetical protein [Amycolatopsis sp. A133]
MTKTIKFLAGGVLAGMVLLPTGTAVAKSAWAYDGNKLVAHAWAPAMNDKGRIAIKDSAAGNSVKAEYYRSGSDTKRTLWNKSGKNATVYSTSGSKVFKFQACEDIDWGGDHCSGYVWVD